MSNDCMMQTIQSVIKAALLSSDSKMSSVFCDTVIEPMVAQRKGIETLTIKSAVLLFQCLVIYLRQGMICQPEQRISF